jgi:hypothetical protein
MFGRQRQRSASIMLPTTPKPAAPAAGIRHYAIVAGGLAIAGALIASLSGVGVAGAATQEPAMAGLAAAGSADVTCPSGFLGVLKVPGDLIVPAGSSCGLTEGSAIGHDVIVEPRASFFIGGTTIGHDLIATDADLIELGDVNNGSSDTIIGHDAIIVGTRGTVPYGEFICQTRIGHDLIIAGTRHTASGWDIGAPEPANCGRNAVYGPRFADTIGHDGIFVNNAGAYLDVGWNEPAYNGNTGAGFGHNVLFVHNREGYNDLTKNTIVHDCVQRGNHPYRGTGNKAGHNVGDCNSANS